MRDGSEDSNLNGAVDTGELDPLVGADDTNVVDADGDGLSAGLEATLGSSDTDDDSDDDGALDGQEANVSSDTDGDGKLNVLDPDSDADGVFDGTEIGQECGNPDTDGSKNQCKPDGDKGATRTSMVNPDTDFGSVPDGEEDANKDGVVDAGEKNRWIPATTWISPNGGTGRGRHRRRSRHGWRCGLERQRRQRRQRHRRQKGYTLEGGGCSCGVAGRDTESGLALLASLAP
ncbi:MAG: hypothetical protein U0263_00030 [Polyangiaceae bacterium]